MIHNKIRFNVFYCFTNPLNNSNGIYEYFNKKKLDQIFLK